MPDRIVLLCALFVLLAPLGAAAQFGAKQEVYEIPPGHDGWVVGDEPAVLIEFDFLGDTARRFGL